MIVVQGVKFSIIPFNSTYFAVPTESLDMDFLFVKYGINKVNFGYFILGYRVANLSTIWPMMKSYRDVEHSLKVLDKLCPLMNQPLLKNIFS